MEATNPNDQPASVFNAAVEYLKALNYLMNLADNAALTFNYSIWYSALRRVENRIHHKINKDEKEEINSLTKTLDGLLIKVHNITITQLRRDTSSPAYISLSELDNLLKKLMDKYGMLMPKASDPRYALMNR